MNPDTSQQAPVDNTSPSPQAPTQSPTQDNSQPSTPVSQSQPQSPDSAPTQNPPSPSVTPNGPSQPTPVERSMTGPTATALTGNNTVSNLQVHPAIQRAGILHEIGQALAGGPRYQTTIDSQGNTTRTAVPLSPKNIGFAIALEAISGALTGLSQSGPNANARGAALAFSQGEQAQQQRQQEQEKMAQQDAKTKSDTLMNQAQSFELNSRTILNTAQSQRMGVESLKDAVSQNAKLLQDYDDAGSISDRNVSEDALKAGMSSGQYDATKQIAVPDGYTNINGHYEQTFSVVTSPSAKVPLSNEQVQEFAQAGIPGFQPYRDGSKIVDDFRVPGTVVARANSQLQALNLMKQDVSEVQNTLAQSGDKGNLELSKSIPDFQSLLDDPKRGAGLFGALQRFQKYISHSDQHGMDFAQSLAQMANPSKPDPNNPKAVVVNSDAAFAQTIYGAFGNGNPALGKTILNAYHTSVEPLQITSEAQAADLIASSEPGSRSYKYAQRWIASNTAQKAAVARAGRESGTVGTPGTPGNANLISSTPANGVNTAYLQTLPPAQQAIVRAIGEGRQEGPNTRTAQGQTLSQMVNSAYPDYDGTRFHTYQAMQKDFVSGKSSQGLLALNTALSHLQTAYDNANLGSTLPGISNLERLGGNQSAVALRAASTAVADELGRAYKAGVVSETERQQWQSLLNGWTPANVRQNAIAFAHLLDGKLSSYEQSLRNGAPSAAVRLPALMSPQAAQAYTHMTGDAPATSVGTNQSGPQQPATQPAPQPAPQTAPHFSKITSDGKMGWNGQQWVTIPQPNQTGGRQ